ncbi:hypothetical protein FRB98_009566 [Tulasnella sp. 332]|nr:hypothetical protein FRB98_009566 [Tulasnella sp. 332]
MDPIVTHFIVQLETDGIRDTSRPAQSCYHRWLKNSGFGPFPASLRDEYDPRLSYTQSVYTFPRKLLPVVEKLLPYGLMPGAVLGNTPDPSTGETRMLYMYFMEGSHLVIAAGGWGVTGEQRPHGIDELRNYAKSLHNAGATPQFVFELFDLLEADEDECCP